MCIIKETSNMECKKCGLKFCDSCGLERNVCDDCFICYGELHRIRKFKNKKI